MYAVSKIATTKDWNIAESKLFQHNNHAKRSIPGRSFEGALNKPSSTFPMNLSKLNWQGIDSTRLLSCQKKMCQ